MCSHLLFYFNILACGGTHMLWVHVDMQIFIQHVKMFMSMFSFYSPTCLQKKWGEYEETCCSLALAPAAALLRLIVCRDQLCSRSGSRKRLFRDTSLIEIADCLALSECSAVKDWDGLECVCACVCAQIHKETGPIPDSPLMVMCVSHM